MSIPSDALEFENRSIGVNGEPTLAAAYEILDTHWRAGERNRELALHLFFLSWYCLVEPAHLTGLPDNVDFSAQLNRTLAEAHEYLEPRILDDAEALYVFGLAAQMFWFMFDDPQKWEERALRYRTRYREIAPEGLAPAIFHRRGAYGHYYAGQVTVKGGY